MSLFNAIDQSLDCCRSQLLSVDLAIGVGQRSTASVSLASREALEDGPMRGHFLVSDA
jgi:hypothetical protein